MDSKAISPELNSVSATASRDSKPLPPIPTSPGGQIRPSPLALILPPAIGLLGMTPEQQRQQTFPYSMSTRDGITVYLSSVAFSFIFFNFQAQDLEFYLPYEQRDSITAFFIWIQVLGSLREQEMELERGGEVRKSGMVGLLGLWMSYTWVGMVLLDVWTAWKEGLGQEEFVREKRMRELEEARLRVVEEEKMKSEKGVREEESRENEKDLKGQES
ncbi:hypothetical protein IFR05_004569 [Cadophora sp. M221]|nr:hypothetical protein IFR05_004569 [Cadophora sp. M221]